MNKKFTKLMAALALLVFMMPSLAGWGQSTVTFDASKDVTNATHNSYTNTLTTFVCDDGSTWKAIGFQEKQYTWIGPGNGSGNYLETPEVNGTITSIAVTWSGNTSYYLALKTTDGTELEAKSNPSSSSTETFNVSSYSGTYSQLRLVGRRSSGTSNALAQIEKVVVTYSSGGGSSVATPQLSKGTSYCDEAQSITITCDTEGATIHYTLDGTAPTSASTTYSGAISITETTTLRAIAIKDGESSEEASATYTFVTTLKTMEAIFNAATTPASQVYIHFNNWVITGNNGNNSTLAYLTDGTYGCIIYGSGHGFVAGNVLNGVVPCTLGKQSGMARLENLTISTSGLEVTSGGTVTPVETTINALSAINTGSVVTIQGLTYNGTTLTDGTNTIKYSTAIYGGTSLVNGNTYDITGVIDYDYSGIRINPRNAADVVIGPATLPFSWAGGDKTALMALQGVTANGLGSGYQSTHAPYQVQFDGTGDYILVRTDSQPDVVTIGVKKIGGSANSTITVQASTDGVNFDDGEALTIDGNQNAIVELTSTRTFGADVRYVKMLFTKGSNVGVGPISITKYSTDPTITVSPSSITDFSYTVGGGPSVKSFTVEGSYLGTTAVSITLGTGTNFEMALAEDATTWSSSVSLTPTDGTVSNTLVYVRMKTGLEEGTYSDNVNVTCGSLSETVSLSGTVNPAPVTYTYTAAASITPGKRYIVVGFADNDFEQPYAMAEQKSSNRGAISIASYYDSDEDEFSISSDAGIYEFVISGDETNKYSVYDTKNNGYLYATKGSNALNQQSTLVDAGKWSIENGGDNDNMVITVTISNETREMRFNYSSNNQLFSCYTTGQRDIYLYERTDNDCHIYSATNLDDDMTVEGDMNIHAGVVTVEAGATLTVEGFLDNNDPANLIIEDGGQLYTEDVVEATIKKSINKYTIGINDTVNNVITYSNGWYFISYPLNCDYNQGGDDPTGVTNLITGNSIYDLYLYDPNEDMEWMNYKAHTTDFKLITGHGYLYANAADVTLEFAGSVNYTDPEHPEISLENGYNLVGNPYAYNAYPSVSYYKMNNDGTGITAVLCNDVVEPCTGIIVDNSDGTITDITFSKNQPSDGSAFNGSIQLTLTQQATNRGNAIMDNAIVSFNEGSQLGKFYFGRQNANLYIPQGTEEYAIVSTEAQGEMPVNFKAAENGTYTLTVNPEGVEMNYLHLIDNMTGADIDLLQTPSYTFSAATRDYESRFRLVFAASNSANADSEADNFAFFSNGSWIINNEGEATLQVVDVNGRILSTETVNGSIGTTINAASGVYMLRLINGENVKVQKIVVR